MMRWTVGCLGLVFLGCLLLGCLGLQVPLEALLYLVAGWVFYCTRVLFLVQPSGAGILTALVCLVALAFGVHASFRWFYSQLPASRQAEGGIVRTWPALDRRTAQPDLADVRRGHICGRGEPSDGLAADLAGAAC